MHHSGDSYSFLEVYKEHYVSLINYARSKTGSIEDAEDLVHDLFADFYLNNKEFSRIENIEGYLFTALKRRVLNYWRHQDVRRRFTKQNSLELIEKDHHPSLEIKDLMTEVFEKAKNLSPQCRNVFNLKREELTNKEIANHLDISVKTVEAHYTKAINFLKKNVGYLFSLF